MPLTSLAGGDGDHQETIRSTLFDMKSETLMFGFRFAIGMAFSCMGLSLMCQNASAVDTALAREAKNLLKTHCYRCHGVEKEIPGLDVLDTAGLKRSRSDEPSYIVAGKPDESLLWERMGVDKDMPPESTKKRPTDKELSIIRKWIEEGAEAPVEEKRAHVEETTVLTAIRNDLQTQKRTDRRHLRYFSLHTSANNVRFDEADLRMARAALSKLLNSLGQTSRLHLPEAIQTSEQTNTAKDLVYRIDLRDYGWTVDQWQSAIAGYPYGLSFNDSDMRELADDVEELVGPVSSDGVPYIRADWFIATASFPTVYHKLVNTPQTAQELEQRLGVDIDRDFVQNRLQRAGFASSGVSRHNRLIDRHVGSQTAYYYKSYDFSNSHGRSLLARFPLGPTFDDNDFSKDFAFQHDGGEIIYSLPNGLQAYMLVDAKGGRIDTGPIHIVRDLRETAGTPEIVNGISCFGCHRNGLLDYTNAIDPKLTLTGDARAKVDELYIDTKEMKELLEDDTKRFMAALEQVIGPYLKVKEDKDKDIRSFTEPIRTVAGWYHRDMTLLDAASEMNVENPEDFAAAIRTNSKLLELGLGPLVIKQTVPRKMWDTLQESSASVFQRAAFATRIGSGIAISH